MNLARHLRRSAVLAAAMLGGCALHSKAARWNGHVGPDVEPVFVQHSTYVGIQLAVVLPFVGATSIDAMIDEATASIGRAEGSHLRLVETESNNYWYGVPPLSWLITPVMSNVTIEYRPSREALSRE